ncbi:hypothetical protein F5148DRAFT_1197083, partial [Russula earlei]
MHTPFIFAMFCLAGGIIPSLARPATNDRGMSHEEAFKEWNKLWDEYKTKENELIKTQLWISSHALGKGRDHLNRLQSQMGEIRRQYGLGNQIDKKF